MPSAIVCTIGSVSSSVLLAGLLSTTEAGGVIVAVLVIEPVASAGTAIVIE